MSDLPEGMIELANQRNVPVGNARIPLRFINEENVEEFKESLEELIDDVSIPISTIDNYISVYEDAINNHIEDEDIRNVMYDTTNDVQYIFFYNLRTRVEEGNITELINYINRLDINTEEI